MVTLRAALPACSAVLLICCLARPDQAAGQTPPPDAGSVAPAEAAPAVQDEEADHEALRQLRQVYERAVNENQLDLLAPHLHAEFHGVMITNEQVRTIDDMRAYWQRMRALIGEGGSYTTTLNPERSVIIGDLALARGTSDDLVVTGEGREYRFSTAWSVVCRREGGEWKVLRAQGTMDPVQNEFVQTFLRRAGLQGAAAGGLIGLVLGFVAAMLLRRSRPGPSLPNRLPVPPV